MVMLNQSVPPSSAIDSSSSSSNNSNSTEKDTGQKEWSCQQQKQGSPYPSPSLTRRVLAHHQHLSSSPSSSSQSYHGSQSSPLSKDTGWELGPSPSYNNNNTTTPANTRSHLSTRPPNSAAISHTVDNHPDKSPSSRSPLSSTSSCLSASSLLLSSSPYSPSSSSSSSSSTLASSSPFSRMDGGSLEGGQPRNSPVTSSLPMKIGMELERGNKAKLVKSPLSRRTSSTSSTLPHGMASIPNESTSSIPTPRSQPPPQLAPLRSRRDSTLLPESPCALVGSFEESILSGRMSCLPSQPIPFIAEIGVVGFDDKRKTLKIPKHLVLDFQAYFYDFNQQSTSSIPSSSPYVGTIELPKDYRLPKRGHLQILIRNCLNTAIKVFLVPFEFSDMPPDTRTFIRQSTYATPSLSSISKLTNRASTQTVSTPTTARLAYAIQCLFTRLHSRKIYLSRAIRVVFSYRSVDLFDGCSLTTKTLMPKDPTYIPLRHYHKPSVSSEDINESGQFQHARPVSLEVNRKERRGESSSLSTNGEIEEGLPPLPSASPATLSPAAIPLLLRGMALEGGTEDSLFGDVLMTGGEIGSSPPLCHHHHYSSTSIVMERTLTSPALSHMHHRQGFPEGGTVNASPSVMVYDLDNPMPLAESSSTISQDPLPSPEHSGTDDMQVDEFSPPASLHEPPVLPTTFGR